jgi:hypothetical protein
MTREFSPYLHYQFHKFQLPRHTSLRLATSDSKELCCLVTSDSHDSCMSIKSVEMTFWIQKPEHAGLSKKVL